MARRGPCRPRVEAAAHYLTGSDKRLRVDGPKVRLPQQYTVPLALTLHELSTNAAKHGSLSSPTGQVDLTWTYSRGRRNKLEILWRESGGDHRSHAASSGFGSTLIERGMPARASSAGSSRAVWSARSARSDARAPSRAAAPERPNRDGLTSSRQAPCRARDV